MKKKIKRKSKIFFSDINLKISMKINQFTKMLKTKLINLQSSKKVLN